MNCIKMNNSEVNEITNDTRRAELILEMETLGHRELPPPYSPPNTAINHQPIVYQTVIVQPHLKNSPMLFTCPNCHKRELTKVKYVNSHATHMISGFICGFTIWCMLCCFAAIPYLIPTCKKAEHYCANCDTFLGTHSKCFT